MPHMRCKTPSLRKIKKRARDFLNESRQSRGTQYLLRIETALSRKLNLGIKDMAPCSRGMVFARVLETRCPSEVRGRRESRALDAPVEIPVCRSTRVIATGTAETSRLSPREWFGGLLRALPGERPLLSPLPCPHRRAGWTPGSRRQDHTTSPSAAAFSSGEDHLTPQRPIATRTTFRDDRETSLWWRGLGGFLP
jgi:hypothetical protein